jgi:isoleucyl-tRNA synthetase
MPLFSETLANMPVFPTIAERYEFPAEEARVRRFWKERDIFQKSLEARRGAPTFVFYEGPPTANGRPHPGHVLTRVMKDIFPRFKTMKGFSVPRKAGWDTHGLPVEIEVEKSLGISGKQAIEAYGVERFCHKCIESVFVYTQEWEELTERIGFWVDLSDAYVTYHQSFVESVWWSLSNLFERGLLYQDRKVVWWWAQGGTTLSAAEVGLGYREVVDPSVFVRFHDASDAALSYLAWTTTPWTLPSNVGLAVARAAPYVEVTLPTESGGTERLVVAEALVGALFGAKKGKKDKNRVEPIAVSAPFPGEDLIGRRYRQLLPYRLPDGGDSFRIIAGDFVAIDPSQDVGSGTGIVHLAPAFGEDDYRIAREAGLGFLQLVDEQGRMSPETGDLAGVFCKDADRAIIRRLATEGSLFREEQYKHEYPFCWRASQDPLIQYARPAWFIATRQFRDDFLSNNHEIQWIPEHIQTGRFGNFLENNVDWALSRERYWGTPLPIWRCETSGRCEAVGSYSELLAKPGVAGLEVWQEAKRKDPQLSEHLKVHKPYIDAVTYDSPHAAGARMRRVTEVIDCWYDSGAMPFAQWGYPYAPGSKERFENAFPADFICEAIDQTRGWFNSLLVESTLLYSDRSLPHPYRTCIVLGHVCDEKGRKMSKSEGNYLPPTDVMDVHGADALRWYFLSQGHPWTNARFSSDRVGEAKRDFLIRLQNVFSFFLIYANIDGFDPRADNEHATDVDPASISKGRGWRAPASRESIDRWILSELHLTIRDVDRALEKYEILAASRSLFDFVDRLSNWYVRRSRSRFWATGLTEDKFDAYWTLYESLVTVARLSAPFVPFFAESIYRTLVAEPWGATQPESVHLTFFPRADEAMIDGDLSRRMRTVLDLVALGRAARVDAKLRVRQPLREAVIYAADSAISESIRELLPLIAGELNVRGARIVAVADEYVERILKPNFKAIGPKLGSLVQKLKGALAAANAAELAVSLERDGVCRIDVEGQMVELGPEEIEISLVPREGFAARSLGGLVVVLDTHLDEDLIAEWHAREVVATVNGLRSDRKLAYEARIRLSIGCGPELRASLERHRAYLESETLAKELVFSSAEALGSRGEAGSAGDLEYRVELDVVS